MARFNVNAPDGSIIAVDAPDGATEQDAIAFAAATYKQGVTGIPTEPGANLTPTAVPEPSMQDKLMGLVETPAIVAANIGGLVARPIARMFGEAYGGQGTPQGREMGQRFEQSVTYQPRTQTGQEIVGQAANVLGAIPPTPLTSAGTALSTLAGPAMNQLRPVLTQAAAKAVTPVRNALTNVMPREQPPGMVGMGAANTAEDLMRQQRLEQFNIRATAGERERNLQKQQFESEIQRGAVTGIREETKTQLSEQMRRFEAAKKQDIVKNFERMTEETGAQIADPTMVREVGELVDKALNAQYTKKFDEYKALYNKADNAGETLEPVNYQTLLEYINTKTPTARKTLDPILDSVAEALAMNDPQNTGNITIRALEDIYQQIGKVKNSASAGEMKQLITQMGEGAGGKLYQASRTARTNLAKQFEDVSRVDQLLSTKAGYADRRVALDNVFKHVVLDGSLEEMRTVTTLLKKGGPEGRQAYAELQGQTIQQMKEMLTGGDQMSFKNLNTFINKLDKQGKLEYMFGKTGRDQITELRDTIKDVIVKEPGAVNYPNTAGVVLRGLEILQKSPIKIPLAQTAAEFARTRQVKKQVEAALKQPNKLAPSSTNVNALTGQ